MGAAASNAVGRTAFLWRPVDNASLVFLRVFFGAVLAWDAAWHLLSGTVEHVWVRPRFHSTYYGFSWVEPLPGVGMYVVFGLMVLLGLCVAAGLFYRYSSLLLGLGMTYAFLAERAAYQNHFYLLCLLCFVMACIPAHGDFSLDARLGRVIRRRSAPAWALWLLRGQLGVVYFYGGLAKLNADWLQGEPMRLWLGGYGDYWLIGPFVHEEWLVGFFSYGGLLFDLGIVPLLLWPKSRRWAFVGAVAFHLINHWIFRIGVFPWFMIGATTVFFEPSWPRRWLGRLEEIAAREDWRPRRPALGAGLLCLYAAVQLLVPLRHLLYPGDTSWTEQGHRFAWRMMLRDKRVKAQFLLRDPRSQVQWTVEPQAYLAPWQMRAVLNDPEMILQLCHYLAAEQRQAGFADIEVYARVQASLNGRPLQDLVDPTVDLAAQERGLGAASWILPLRQPLVRR